jgi:glycine/D-amino acid oxidase-like deaminating enzyme
MTTSLTTDVVIIGAGIAGLWLHHRLNDLGYHALLLEKEAIGQGQTLSSQGIIHGGSKYALNGILTKASQVISQMPDRWKACLAGSGEIDLSEVPLLAEHQLLWSNANLSSKLTAFFASKALRSRMSALKKTDCPAPFNSDNFSGAVYQLDEPVLDIPALIQTLSSKWRDRIIQVPDDATYQWKTTQQKLDLLALGDYQISAKEYVLTAGEGNEKLLSDLPIEGPAMQRRPLQMVLCKSLDKQTPLPALYAHNLGPGSKPIATISTHFDANGNTIWYIGGNIAEEGVGKPADIVINEAQDLLAEILPWLSLPKLAWATHKVNRAEPKQSALTRPDAAYVSSYQNVHVCWPTKLALSPDLSDQVIKALEANKLSAGVHTMPPLPSPAMGSPLWDRAFQ